MMVWMVVGTVGGEYHLCNCDVERMRTTCLVYRGRSTCAPCGDGIKILFSIYALKRSLEPVAYAISWKTPEYCFNIDVLFYRPNKPPPTTLVAHDIELFKMIYDAHDSCPLLHVVVYSPMR